jgi:alpha-1,6-mannosyltransferase
MPFAYPTALLGLLTNNMMFKLCAPHLGVMAVLSCLSHKEMRFIFFIIPILNVAAAHFLSQGLKIKGSRVRKISKFFTLALLVTQTLATVFKVYISMKNYPGGVAILDAQKLLQGPARLHIDFFAAQNGVSRFTELNNNWIFDKAEDLKPEQYDKYAYLLTKSPAHHITKFEVVGSWLGYDGLRPNFKGWIKDPVNSLPIQLRYAPKVYFMKRKDLVNSQ